MKIWAHRGCSYAWPENTLQAFEAACRLPVAGIELDIQLTKDGEIVVIHDEKVDRTTDGTGEVQGFLLEELKQLKIQTHFAEDGSSRYTQIPTMEEVFALVKPWCLERGMLINIELKNSIVRYEGMEDKILQMVEKWGLENYIVYSSFNPDSVRLLKEIKPSVKTGILAPTLSECLAFAQTYPVDALHPFVKKLDVENWRDQSFLPIRVWNVRKHEPFFPDKTPVEIQDLETLERAGVTDIFTNVPERYLDGTGEK